MLGVTGTTQYINPDYIQPLPTSLDTKNSPLALLAQTCSSIGKDNSPTSAASSSSSLLSSSSSSSTSKLNQHQQIHSSSTTSDKKDSSQKLLNGKDQTSRMKSSDPNADHNGVHHHNHHHHGSGGSSYNHYKMSSGKSSYSERLSKENGRSSTGRLSASPPKNKLSSSNGYGLNGNKNHLPKSEASNYRGAMSYYGNGKDDYMSGTLPSVHHHHQQQQQQQSSKMSPSTSPLQNLKMQQELFNAAFGMGYPPWMMGQSPFMPPAFDPFFLSAAALSSQHKQHLLQLHQQLFSSLSGYPPSESGSSGLPLGSSGTGQTGGSGQKHDTDAGHSPTSKSSTASHNSPAGSNPLLSGSSLSSLFPAHIPGHSSSQGQQLSPSGHPYACNWLQPGSDFCGKRFSTYEELLEHLKTHVAGSSPGQGGPSDEGRLFPASFFPFMFGMAPPFALPSGYNSSYLLQQQQQAAAASLFQRSYSPSAASSSSSSSLSTTSTNSRYHPYKQPALSSPSVFPSLLPFPTPSSSTVASQFSSLMPPYMGYGFPYPMYGGQKLSETAAGP